MMKLQNDNYNVFAEYGRPILLKYVDRSSLMKRIMITLTYSPNGT